MRAPSMSSSEATDWQTVGRARREPGRCRCTQRRIDPRV